VPYRKQTEQRQAGQQRGVTYSWEFPYRQEATISKLIGDQGLPDQSLIIATINFGWW
jgi:hypothetical protein